MRRRFAKRKGPAGPITPESLAASGSEDGNQMALFQWFALNRPTYPHARLLFAIPMGGLRHKVTAARLKATGAKRGVPDLFLPVPCYGFPGLFVELKKDTTEGTSPDQDKWKSDLIEQGYGVAVAYGWEHARDIIVTYLTGNYVQLKV